MESGFSQVQCLIHNLLLGHMAAPSSHLHAGNHRAQKLHTTHAGSHLHHPVMVVRISPHLSWSSNGLVHTTELLRGHPLFQLLRNVVFIASSLCVSAVSEPHNHTGHMPVADNPGIRVIFKGILQQQHQDLSSYSPKLKQNHGVPGHVTTVDVPDMPSKLHDVCHPICPPVVA